MKSSLTILPEISSTGIGEAFISTFTSVNCSFGCVGWMQCWGSSYLKDAPLCTARRNRRDKFAVAKRRQGCRTSVASRWLCRRTIFNFWRYRRCASIRAQVKGKFDCKQQQSTLGRGTRKICRSLIHSHKFSFDSGSNESARTVVSTSLLTGMRALKRKGRSSNTARSLGSPLVLGIPIAANSWSSFVQESCLECALEEVFSLESVRVVRELEEVLHSSCLQVDEQHSSKIGKRNQCRRLHIARLYEFLS